MATGMEWMIKTVLDGLGLDKEQIQKQVAEAGQIMANGKAQLDRIEAHLNARSKKDLADAIRATDERRDAGPIIEGERPAANGHG